MKINKKNNKGVTLTSVVIYVIALTIVVGIVGRLITYMYKNTDDLDSALSNEVKYTKFNSFITDEINVEGNYVADSGEDYIVFSKTKNQYTYKNGAIYQNLAKICDSIDSCSFGYNEEEKVISVQLEFGEKTYNNSYKILDQLVEELPWWAGRWFDSETTITLKNGAINVPGGSAISKIRGEFGGTEGDINDGIVIYIMPEEVAKAPDTWKKDENNNGILDVQETYDQFVWVPVENAVLDLTDNPATTDVVETNYYSTIDNDQIIKDAVANAKDENGKQIYPMAIKTDATNYIGVLYEFNDSETEDKVEISLLESWFPKDGTDNREPDAVTGYDGEVDGNGNPLYLLQMNGILGYTSTNTNYISDETKFKDILQVEYNEMVNSVKDNGGFWIGRYETSNMRNDETAEENNRVQVKTVKGANNSSNGNSLISGVTWYRRYAEQRLYSSKANLNKTKSSMIWGSQWDQVMIWMKDVENKNQSIADKKAYYVTNAIGMGNYGLSDYDPYPSLTETGKKEDFKVKNIYDMAGNIDDWTIEVYNNYGRTGRGGSYGSTTCIYGAKASYHSFHAPGDSCVFFGTRLSLY